MQEIIKTSQRICMCCGERKEVIVGEAYCSDCSISAVGALFVTTEKSQKGHFSISTVKPII